MAVAKRQGREKPAKIEQTKVRGPEWGPQVEQIVLLASPIYIGQAQGEEKKKKYIYIYIYRERERERGAKGPGVSPAHWGTLFFVSLGRHALNTSRMDFLLFSKLNRAVTWSCNTDFSKSYNMVCPRPESCDTPRALMYITPNLCSDEAEPRSIHLPDTWNKIII